MAARALVVVCAARAVRKDSLGALGALYGFVGPFLAVLGALGANLGVGGELSTVAALKQFRAIALGTVRVGILKRGLCGAEAVGARDHDSLSWARLSVPLISSVGHAVTLRKSMRYAFFVTAVCACAVRFG